MGKLREELEKKKKQLRELKEEIKELEIELGTYKNPIPDLKGKVIKMEVPYNVNISGVFGTSYLRVENNVFNDCGWSGFRGVFISITEDRGNKRINIETDHCLNIGWEDWDEGKYSIVPRQEFDELLDNWLEENSDVLNRE